MIILLIPITLVLIMLFYVIFEMAFGTEKKEQQDLKDSMSKEEYDNLKKNDN